MACSVRGNFVVWGQKPIVSDDSSLWEGTSHEPVKLGSIFNWYIGFFLSLKSLKLSGTLVLSLVINLSGKNWARSPNISLVKVISLVVA